MSALRRLGAMAVGTLAAAAVLTTAAPAAAHWRGGVYIGAYPYYPAYYPYPYYPYPYYYYGYGYDLPPPGWVPGHWELRVDDSGRRVRVWVPTHLQ
ncbi:MAG TPA: hypothetical protein VKW76_01445 [Candidatus Binatia bacterium]|nr:hypothetical protein [Candidatus Binatia bacterium]